MSRCSIAPSAIRDLDDISDYFLERNIQAGEQLLQEFTKKCRNLATFPTMGKSYSQVRADLRGIPLQGYIILYRLIDDGLEIVRVVNARQDLESLFEEEEWLILKCIVLTFYRFTSRPGDRSLKSAKSSSSKKIPSRSSVALSFCRPCQNSLPCCGLVSLPCCQSVILVLATSSASVSKFSSVKNSSKEEPIWGLLLVICTLQIWLTIEQGSTCRLIID